MTWDGTVPTFSPGKLASSKLQQLADIATHLAQYFTDGGWSTFTPTWSGHGSATFSTNTGRYKRIGPRTVLFATHAQINAAGSGSSNVGFTLPTEPSRAIRWTFVGASEGGTALSGLHALVLVSGSGTTVDRIRYAGDTNLLGSNLAASKYFSFSGTYQEAS